MSILVVAEHDNSSVKVATLNAVAAAQQIGGDIAVLVAGSNCAGAAEAASKINGVAKVLVADNAAYEHMLAENVAALIAQIVFAYSGTSDIERQKHFATRCCVVRRLSDFGHHRGY